jgi:predicted protein tyrosine phosphatase
MRVFMYDNDEDNFKGMRPEIECVYVDSAEPNPLVADPHDPSSYYTQFAKKYPHNPYIRLLRSYGPEYLLQDPQPGNGITEAMTQKLLRVAARSPGEQKVVFFDWDGTLIVTEGMIPLAEKEVGMDVIEGQLAFVMGGPKRLALFRRFFRLLHEMSVDMYILTNNQMFLEPKLQKIFYNYVERLTPYIPRSNVFGSVVVLHSREASNKALYLSYRQERWNKEKIIPDAAFDASERVLCDGLRGMRGGEIMVQAFLTRPAKTVQAVVDKDATVGDLKKKIGARGGVFYYGDRKMGSKELIRDVAEQASPLFVVKKK